MDSVSSLIADLWREGKNTAEIAGEMMVRECDVVRVLAEPPPPPSKSRDGKMWTEAEIAQAKALLEAGVTAQRAGRIMGRRAWGLAEMARRKFGSHVWRSQVSDRRDEERRRAKCERASGHAKLTTPRMELEDIALYRVTDTLKGCGREIRNVAFYGSASDIAPQAPLMGCNPVSRLIERRVLLGGGVLSKWAAVQ